MGAMSFWHWAIVIVVVLVLFGGRGKLSGIMGDAAKGIRAFKDGLKDDTGAKDKDAPGALPRTDAEKEELNR
ncbi:twin-arginine translocase TatA/TatE family subunit [Brevundimonas diminuta]|uniref:Sec-independent protein translocase protein TatA n=1 Tax=Brevundimonas diminuta TaxID=293 RepID=A0A2X1AMG3_BREDI|nr:twin-arginine translocase TatA/TatE family subunit [Brevundimonas diminuta]SPU45983.1 Sec-independent protein translocase protein TatA [Brevundimonas diminuta]